MHLKTTLDFQQTPRRIVIFLKQYDLLGDFALETIVGELWLCL